MNNMTLDELEESIEQLFKLLSKRRVVEKLEADWWDKVEKLVREIGNYSKAEPDAIELTKEKYKKMQERLRKLDALEAGGVDNWEGYSYALNECSEEEEED